MKSAARDYQVSSVASLKLLRGDVIAQDRLLTLLSTLFGALGTLLALIGFMA